MNRPSLLHIIERLEGFLGKLVLWARRKIRYERAMSELCRLDDRDLDDIGLARIDYPELAWRQATHAIVGFSIAVCDQNLDPKKIDEAVVNLLGMVGIGREEAWEIAKRRSPKLPEE